jgi:peroxiredoxin
VTELSVSGPALGWHPSDFALEGTDGRRHRLADVRGAKGTIVMFICNHCPYVQAVLDDIIRDVRELKGHGIGAIGLMPNDVAAYPADSFENMKRLAETKQLPFPYVIDGAQEVARAFGAACTPDFFGFNADSPVEKRGSFCLLRGSRDTFPLSKGGPSTDQHLLD